MLRNASRFASLSLTVALVTALQTGCSFYLQQVPHPDHENLAEVDCTSEPVFAALDGLFALGNATTFVSIAISDLESGEKAVGMVTTGVAALIYGLAFRKGDAAARSCREAKYQAAWREQRWRDEMISGKPGRVDSSGERPANRAQARQFRHGRDDAQQQHGRERAQSQTAEEGDATPSADSSRPESLSAGGLRTVLSGADEKVTSCRAGDSTSSESALLKIQISPEGKVVHIEIRDTNQPVFAACVGKVVRGLVFPATKNGGTFEFPFVVRPIAE